MDLLCPVSPPPAFSLFLPLASACLGAALLLGKPVAHLHNNSDEIENDALLSR